MIGSDIQRLNEAYNQIASPTSSIKAIWSEFRNGGQARAFNLTPAQQSLFANGVGATLKQWASVGSGEIHDGLERFVQDMKISMGYRPGIDAPELNIDVTPEGNAGGVTLNDNEALTFIDAGDADFRYLDNADDQTLQEIVDDVALRADTIMFSQEIGDGEWD